MHTRLTLAAVACALMLAGPAIAADKLELSFKKADADNDGSLDKEEAKSMPKVAKNFDAIDADKSGTVTLEEIHASMKVEGFTRADKNADHMLDKEEAKALPRVARNFDSIDTDKDGSLTEEEVDQFMKARREQQ